MQSQSCDLLHWKRSRRLLTCSHRTVQVCFIAQKPLLQVILIHLLRSYTFTLGPDQAPLQPAKGALMPPAQGLHMGVCLAAKQ